MIKLVSKSWLLPVLLFTSFLSMTNAESTGETTADTSTQTTIASSNSSSSTTVYTPTTITSETKITTTKTTTTTAALKGCPKETPSLENGEITLDNDSTTLESKAYVTCDEGYFANPETIFCQENGTWSTVECIPKDCTDPPTVSNGNRTFTSTTFLSKATYFCNPGYNPETNHTITCQENGTWSTLTFSCTLKDCTDPPTVSNGNRTFTSTTFRSKATYFCNPGYNPDINHTITCQENGTWSTLSFSCTLKEVQYNHTCDQSGPNEQCVTQNAVCQNGLCTCESSHQYVKDENICEMRPALPENFTVNITEKNVTKESFIVSWTEGHSVFGIIDPPTQKEKNFSKQTTVSFYEISELQSGTHYCVCIYIVQNNIRSENCSENCSYTVPDPVTIEKVTDVSEDGFTVNWDPLHMCEKYEVNISSKNRNESKPITVFLNTSISSYTFTNLTAGTQYTFTIKALAGNFSSSIQSRYCYTLPRVVENASVLEQHTSSLKIGLTYKGPNSDLLRFCLDIPLSSKLGEGEEDPDYNCTNITIIQDNKQIVCTAKREFTIQGLDDGREYIFNVSTCLNHLGSEGSYEFPGMTRPKNAIDMMVTVWNETSLEVSWYVEGNVSLYISSVNEQNISNAFFEGNGTHLFENLTAGTKYSISAYRVIGMVYSENATSVVTYTRPLPPHVNILEHCKDSLDIGLNRTTYISMVRVTATMTDGSVAVNETKQLDEETHIKVEDLAAGTYYNIMILPIIKFEVDTIEGLSSAEVETYTRPDKVDGIVGVSANTTDSMLYVKWNEPHYHYNFFQVCAECKGPNTNSNTTKYNLAETNKTYAEVANLSPGTVCSISVVVTIINVGAKEHLDGPPAKEQIKISTKEKAPGMVKQLNKTDVKAHSFTTKWTAPDTKNGIIRRYDALLLDEEQQCKKRIIYTCQEDICADLLQAEEGKTNYSCNQTVTTNTNFTKEKLNFSWNFSQLHPFRNYTVMVFAYTLEAGLPATFTVETLEYIPGVPLDLKEEEVTNSYITLNWKPPKERNGIVRNYTIEYSYAENDCYTEGDVITETIHYIPTDEHLKTIQINKQDIYPFWNYSFRIKATNNVGTGNYSQKLPVRTKEKEPGEITNITAHNISSAFNAHVSWSKPCFAGGMIKSYSWCLVNISTVKHGLPEWKHCYNTSDKNYSAQFPVLPYRNYSFFVYAINSAGKGNESELVNISSPSTFPEAPSELQIEKVDSTTIKALWKTPTYFYGPVRYFVEAIDVKEPHLKFNSTTQTAYWIDTVTNTSLIVGLDAYWGYNVTVSAITDGVGERKSQTEFITTKEAVPGTVAFVLLSPESNVTKERSIRVLWEEPRKRDLNGVLRNYSLTCTNTNDSKVITAIVESDTKSYTFKGILPGIYRLEISAVNNAGTGKKLENTTILTAGAPIKLGEEKQNSFLMKPSSAKVSDDTKQIYVQLPLKDFLCNTRNGKILKWGVVVVEDGNQDDHPFSGTRTEYKKQRLSVYKKWSDVKDDDSIPAYIATPQDWRPQCSSQNEGNRRKRSTDPQLEPAFENFLVGQDGDCSGVSGDYCNGELQPGRSYRVRSFACTSGGCTETKYSQPISTEPDLTAPIAAGVSSAIIVLIGAGLVIFILRRKQAVCFAKDAEGSSHTHMNSSDISMGPIEPKKKNSFSPATIKLTDFPHAVENMHKDSDLLFADAYKLLKDKSPNHPMTAAEQQCCRPKNRYTNILPFDHSRVKLRPSDDIEGSDYINANYIPGYTSKREYIATQGPMLATFDDFWRMVWEQNVDTIVMLTKLMEKGRRKCDKYWPDMDEPVFYGDLVVSIQSESNLSDYVIKIIEIKLKEEKRTVRHFSYLKWPDMGCPETPELLLEFVKAVRQYTNRDKQPSSGPTIVHCSAGVGRTGTFIAVDYLLQHIRDHDDVDIFNLVLDMRNHRLNMVQTEDQYVYIHECLKAFITTDEEEEEDDEPVYMNTGEQEEHIYENTAFQKD